MTAGLKNRAATGGTVSAPTERTFTGDPTTPAAARAFAKSAVAGLLRAPVPDSLCDDVELIVSELVTNAVRAGSASVYVELGLDGPRLLVQVTDEAAGWPEQRDAGIRDTGGRGLPLVSALSSAWGVRMIAAGKVVWAMLDIPLA